MDKIMAGGRQACSGLAEGRRLWEDGTWGGYLEIGEERRGGGL